MLITGPLWSLAEPLYPSIMSSRCRVRWLEGERSRSRRCVCCLKRDYDHALTPRLKWIVAGTSLSAQRTLFRPDRNPRARSPRRLTEKPDILPGYVWHVIEMRSERVENEVSPPRA